MNALPHVIAVLLGLRSWGCPDANLDELYHGLGYEAFHSVFFELMRTKCKQHFKNQRDISNTSAENWLGCIWLLKNSWMSYL